MSAPETGCSVPWPLRRETAFTDHRRTAVLRQVSVCPEVCLCCAQHNFTTIAEIMNLALGGVSPPFDPYLDDTSFLLATYIFEDVGVTAYLVRCDLNPVKSL